MALSVGDAAHVRTLALLGDLIDEWPKPGEEVTLERLAVGDYIRIAGEDVQYLGHVGGIMRLLDERDIEHQYPSSDGEVFSYVGSPF